LINAGDGIPLLLTCGVDRAMESMVPMLRSCGLLIFFEVGGEVIIERGERLRWRIKRRGNGGCAFAVEF